MLGPEQPVILHLLDIPPAAQSLEGVKMELIDAALPLLAGERWRSIGPCCANANQPVVPDPPADTETGGNLIVSDHLPIHRVL